MYVVYRRDRETRITYISIRMISFLVVLYAVCTSAVTITINDNNRVIIYYNL